MSEIKCRTTDEADERYSIFSGGAPELATSLAIQQVPYLNRVTKFVRSRAIDLYTSEKAKKASK